MAFENLFIRSKKSIGGVSLDAVISESHNNTVTLTKNPVELGADITDHAIIQPKQIQIIAQVSDSPLGVAAFSQISDLISGLFGSSTSENLTRSNAAYAAILQIMEARQPISVQTKLKLYNDLIITTLSVTQDKDSSRIVLMSITLDEVLITESKIIKLDPKQLKSGVTQTQASSAEDRGRESTSTPNNSTNKSVLKTVFDWVN